MLNIEFHTTLEKKLENIFNKYWKAGTKQASFKVFRDYFAFSFLQSLSYLFFASAYFLQGDINIASLFFAANLAILFNIAYSRQVGTDCYPKCLLLNFGISIVANLTFSFVTAWFMYANIMLAVGYFYLYSNKSEYKFRVIDLIFYLAVTVFILSLSTIYLGAFAPLKMTYAQIAAIGYALPFLGVVFSFTLSLRDNDLKIDRSTKRYLKLTEQLKRSQSLLKKQASTTNQKVQLLKAISNNLPVVMYTTNRDGICMNALGNDLVLGDYKPQDLVGKSLVSIFGRKRSIVEVHEQAIEGYSGSYEWTTDEYVLQVFVKPLINEYDTIVGCVGVAIDISERKKFEEDILKAKEEAEAAMRSKAEFLSTMSHEIRTPMNAVIGMSHLLLDEDPKPDQLDNLNTLKFSAENLLTLINDILDFSKIESGRVEIEYHDFDLHRLSTATIQALDVKAREKNIYLKAEFSDTVPQFIKGDSTRLSQILNNLVGNAIKFTDKGGVTIRFDVTEKKNEKLRLYVEVQDTGIGVAKDKHAQIFEQFSQADSATTRKYGGTGLGLTITKKLIELMGGDIQLDSELGSGARFYFTINCKSASPQVEQKAQLNKLANSKTSIKDRSILVVEDNIVNQKIAQKFLEKWGAVIEFANNGREGLEKVRQNQYDMILMDLQMPVMDGYEATKEIRKMDNLKKKNTPIIALTADAMGDVRERIKEVGMNDYVSKPFNPKFLQDTINSHLND